LSTMSDHNITVSFSNAASKISTNNGIVDEAKVPNSSRKHFDPVEHKAESIQMGNSDLLRNNLAPVEILTKSPLETSEGQKFFPLETIKSDPAKNNSHTQKINPEANLLTGLSKSNIENMNGRPNFIQDKEDPIIQTEVNGSKYEQGQTSVTLSHNISSDEKKEQFFPMETNTKSGIESKDGQIFYPHETFRIKPSKSNSVSQQLDISNTNDSRLTTFGTINELNTNVTQMKNTLSEKTEVSESNLNQREITSSSATTNGMSFLHTAATLKMEIKAAHFEPVELTNPKTAVSPVETTMTTEMITNEEENVHSVQKNAGIPDIVSSGQESEYKHPLNKFVPVEIYSLLGPGRKQSGTTDLKPSANNLDIIKETQISTTKSEIVPVNEINNKRGNLDSNANNTISLDREPVTNMINSTPMEQIPQDIVSFVNETRPWTKSPPSILQNRFEPLQHNLTLKTEAETAGIFCCRLFIVRLSKTQA
jgi:hypothetical protein